jgi:anti-sigma B factor antagonist
MRPQRSQTEFPVAGWRCIAFTATIMAAFTTSRDGNVNILRITGKLDPFAWKDLKDTMAALTAGDEQLDLLVDLGGMDFMASSGFRELFLAGKNLSRKGRWLAVCSLQGEVKRVFDLAKFDTAYPIFESPESALEWLRSGAPKP